MPLNIFVAGNPGSVRETAEAVRQIATGVEDTATGWQHTRSRSEADWEGQAGDAFRNKAGTTGRDADALRDLFSGLSQALTAFADDLATVKIRMDQAQQVATGGGLKMMGSNLILGSGPILLPPEEQKRQQTAFDEARETITQAREMEKTAHERLASALKGNADGLAHISRAGAWSQAAAAATSPAATALAGAAAMMDDRATNATKGLLEKAASTGPAAVSGLWGSLTSAQRTDLMDRFPQMVGNTNGVPSASRDHANRSILESQRNAISSKLDSVKRQMREDFERHGHSDTSKGKEIQELTQARSGIEALQGKLGASADASNHYLLGIDSTAQMRGQAIIAHGNPDYADNTMTMVPGTYSDLGGVVDYVEDNDKVLNQANDNSDTKNVAITWTDYESPNHLVPSASFESYADGAHSDLTNFQEGLRVTHQGEAPSHNTLMGHSYGSTVVGEAAANGGSHADNLVFLGSPGVGVDNANQLDVPGDHVWGGTSRDDEIHAASSINPLDYGNGRDDHWFGVNPSDPTFGGQTMPTDPTTAHDGYWDKPVSRDAMADIMLGRGGNS